jgi:tetratricopeptide (TPR) repeat protein
MVVTMFRPVILVTAYLSPAAWLLSAQDFEALAKQAEAALESNPAEAAKLYRQAVTMRPDWAEGWFYLGASLYGTHEYGESQQAFQRATKLAADNGTVWAFLGLCEYQMGKYSQALADMRKGEELGLGDRKQFVSSIHNHAALVYLREGKFGLAMEQLEPLVRIGDDSEETIEGMGVGALGMPMLPADVSADKREMVRLAGRTAWAVYAQKIEEGRKLAAELAEKYPSEPGVHYLYGLCLARSDPEAALREYRKELQIRPRHVATRLQAAVLETKQGAPQAAIELALEATKLEPSNPYCYVTLGRAYLSIAQMPKAIEALEQAVKLAPQNRPAHLYLAQAYRRAGRIQEADREQAEYARLKTAQGPMELLEGGGMPAAQ